MLGCLNEGSITIVFLRKFLCYVGSDWKPTYSIGSFVCEGRCSSIYSSPAKRSHGCSAEEGQRAVGMPRQHLCLEVDLAIRAFLHCTHQH